jgi:predicted DCC family thiol-disulfide oxidoreductase YuxK
VDFDTIVFVPDWNHRERPDFLVRTNGVIAALRAMRSAVAWTVAALLAVIPARLRDAGYRIIGHWRYRFFGPWRPRPLPRAEWAARFLE